MHLVPLKVKIGLRANGHADHPDWHTLPLAQDSDPASHMKHGWKYDKTSGHAEHSADSPVGMQWGLVLVSEQFAAQALVTFSEICSVMTEVEAKAFWDEKAHAHVPEEKIDTDALQGLKAERDLLVDLGRLTDDVDARIGRALDSDDVTRGKTRQKGVRWESALAHLNIELADSVERIPR